MSAFDSIIGGDLQRPGHSRNFPPPDELRRH